MLPARFLLELGSSASAAVPLGPPDLSLKREGEKEITHNMVGYARSAEEHVFGNDQPQPEKGSANNTRLRLSNG
jgi:hypothetical protein